MPAYRVLDRRDEAVALPVPYLAGRRAYRLRGLAGAYPLAAAVRVDDGSPIATSFPIFEPLMKQLGAHIERTNRTP